MHNDNGKIFITTLYNLLFAPDLRNWSFCIITLMNLRHTCLFNRSFCTGLFSDNEQKIVTLPQSAHRKCAFLEKKEKEKLKNQTPKRQLFLEILYQRLVHRSTRSILLGDTENVWKKLNSGYILNVSAHHLRYHQVE